MTLINVKPTARKKRNEGLFLSDIDRFFNDFFRTDFPGYTGGTTFNQTQPAINVLETADTFQLELAVPGLEKSDLTLKVEKDVLHVIAKKDYQTAENVKIRKQQFGNYDFERTFRLAKSIDNESISAKVNNGVLVVELPKKEEAKEQAPRTIEVS